MNSIEEVQEEKIEAIVLEHNLFAVINAVKSAHPYEEPAIHLTKVIDYKSILERGCEKNMSVSFRGVSIVLEGLDGVGKSVTADRLAKRLGTTCISTPPASIKPFRSYFDRESNADGGGDTSMRKAYYMVCII